MMEISKAKFQGQQFKAVQEKSAKEPTTNVKGGQKSEKVTDVDVKLSMKAKLVEFLLVVKKEAKSSFETQSGLVQQTAGEGLDLANLQYNGKPLTELSPEEAQGLIAEDGYFGVTQTSERIAEFVISGAGDDLERLQAGRQGVLKGFQDAEALWGGKLPDISYQTFDKTLEMIDARIKELGGTLVDVSA